MENIRMWHNNDTDEDKYETILILSVTDLKHSHGVSGESSASLTFCFWQHVIADALEKFVRTVQMPNTEVIFLLKMYPIAFWTEWDV